MRPGLCTLRAKLYSSRPIAGGPSLHVANTVSILATRGASWSRDGYVYFAGNAASGLERVSENGGAVEGVTTLDSARHERTHRWPQALPDGSAVLFTSDTVASSEYYDDARIEAVRPATGERKTLVEGTSMARFLPPDRLVFARGGALFAVRFDPRTLQVRGTPVVVAQGLSTTVSSGAVQFAISETGTLVWVPSQSGTGLKQLVWIDRNGGEEPLDVQAGEYAQLALSPDGRQVAIAESLPPDMSLWILDLARKSLSRLTFQGTVSNPTWTPDSARIAYGMSAAQESTTQIVWQRADGSSAAEPMLEDTPSRPFSFSPDGRLLAFGHFDAHQADATLWLLPVGRASEAHAYPGIEASSFQAEISPDARWIAYSSLDSGAGEVYLRPFPAGDGKWQVSTGVGHEPHWARDGSAIFYRSSSDILRVDADLAHGVHLGMARRVGSSLFGGTVANTFSVAADGRILTLRHPPDVTRTSEVDLATGWGRKVDALLAAKH